MSKGKEGEDRVRLMVQMSWGVVGGIGLMCDNDLISPPRCARVAAADTALLLVL